MSTNINETTVLGVYSGFNAQDWAGLLDLVTEDFELEDVALGMSWHGKEGWREWLSAWTVSLPDAMTRVDSITVDGDRVVTEHTGGGTHTGPLQTPAGTIPPTGRTIQLRFAEVYDMRDGKIKAMRAYWDTATLMRQLGLM